MTDDEKILAFPAPEPEIIFSLDIYKDNQHGWFTNIASSTEEDTDEDLRELADALDDLSLKIRRRAEEIKSSPKGECVASVHVFKDSTVRVMYDREAFETEEQKAWLTERIDEAKEAVVTSSVESTKHSE